MHGFRVAAGGTLCNDRGLLTRLIIDMCTYVRGVYTYGVFGNSRDPRRPLRREGGRGGGGGRWWRPDGGVARKYGAGYVIGAFVAEINEPFVGRDNSVKSYE